MAERDPALRDRQPWKAAYGKDYGWLGDVITKHHHGDDSDVKILMAGILQAFAGMRVEEYQAAAHAFLQQGRHPTLGGASAATGRWSSWCATWRPTGSPPSSPEAATGTSCGR